MEVIVFNNDIDGAIKSLKKAVLIDGVHRQVRIRFALCQAFSSKTLQRKVGSRKANGKGKEAGGEGGGL